MPTYFHLRQTPQQTGDLIYPTMRSILDLYQHAYGQPNQPWRLAAELLLELVRSADAPHAVSRLDSNFVFMSEDEALQQIYRMGGSKVLLEVELADPAAPTFLGDFALITELFIVDGAQFLPKARVKASEYWAAGPRSAPELLTTSPLRVIRTVRTFL